MSALDPGSQSRTWLSECIIMQVILRSKPTPTEHLSPRFKRRSRKVHPEDEEDGSAKFEGERLEDLRRKPWVRRIHGTLSPLLPPTHTPVGKPVV